MKETNGAPRVLPERPNLDHLKNQARQLLQRAQAGDDDALTRVVQHHPEHAKRPVGAALTLSDAQLVIAREYGFRSWPKLRAHVLRVSGAAQATPSHAAAEAGCERIRERLRRLGRVDGSVSMRDLRRIEGPLDTTALIALAVRYCKPEARQALAAGADPAAVAAALDAVIGAREPQPVGASPSAPDADDSAAACLAVLYCGGFPHLLGRRFPLTRERVTLGRALERDVALNDDSVSRLHCTIEHRDGRFVLRDERSTNGTFVASAGTFVNQAPEPVSEHTLVDGDQFAVGDVILAFLQIVATGSATPAERRAQLEAKYSDAINYIANHDALTRLYNRPAFDRELNRAVLYARGEDRPLSALLLDLDDFKQHNDSLGSLAGNGLLLRVAQVLREELGDRAIVGRYGGDKYAVLLPALDLSAALAVAERLRNAVQSRPLELAGKRIRATASVGVATLYRTTGAEELLIDARAALRAAKEAGRNTVRPAA